MAYDQATAFWMSGSWAPPVYKPPFDWDWAVLPPVTPGGSVSLGVGIDSFVVPSGSKNQALAKDFIKFMISKQQLEKGMGRVPARNDVDIAKVVAGNVIEQQITEATHTYKIVPIWPVPVAISDAAQTAIGKPARRIDVD